MVMSFIASLGFGTTPTGDSFVQLRVQTNDALGETVFSPAGASVKVWDKTSGDFLGALTEDSSHDGKWDSAFNVLVGSTVVLKVEDSGSTYYTRQVEQVVPEGASNVDRIGVLDPIEVYPRSATSLSDMTGTLMTAGVEVDNSTGIASGETDIQIILAVASGKTWGGQAYYDYETGKEYIGAFMVFDLTTTTASATITGGVLYANWETGSHEYWVFLLPQIHNDADVAGDGTYDFTITFNNLVAAADALDLGLYTNAKAEDVDAHNFGTNDAGGASAGECWTDIHLS